jgi:site-specific recombinase XerD
MEPKQIQQRVIDYVIDMRDNRRLSPNTISLRVSALQTFFLINDIEDINWPKIKRFKGEFYTVADDRPYTRQEISKLVNSATSLRDKAIILLLSSSGLRVGGLVKLQLKHMKAIDNYHIYQFAVYKSSREHISHFVLRKHRTQ